MTDTGGTDPGGVGADADARVVAAAPEPRPRHRMLRVVRVAVVAVVAAVVAGVAVSTAHHWWQTPRDTRAIEQEIGNEHRYVDVDGRRMSVAVQGAGPHTIVLLPGLGTPAPILDFAPLARRLAERNTVVTVEYFGLGLSGATDVPRTSEAIVGEVRSALRDLGLPGPYVLMPHSISGIYAMWWVDHRPGEIAAVVGLDDERYLDSQADDSADWPRWMSAVTALGGVRDLISLDTRTDYLGLAADYRESLGTAHEYTPRQQELYLRAYSWVLNSTMLDEAAREAENLRAIEGVAFPPSMPALSILASSSLTAEPEWEAAHRVAITNPAIQRIEVLGEHHYLFRAEAAAIAGTAQRFLDEHVPAP